MNLSTLNGLLYLYFYLHYLETAPLETVIIIKDIGGKRITPESITVTP